MASTEHRIFGIFEMLEAILHNLPQRDLLLNQGVCKTWKEVVEKSEKLQKALFFMPESEVRWTMDKGGRIHRDVRTPHGSMIKPKLNPLLVPVLNDLYKGKCKFDKTDKVIFPEPRKAGDGNWRRMLLTQPALSSLYLETLRLNNSGSYDSVDEKVVNVDGITAGDCIKKLEEARGKDPKGLDLCKACVIANDFPPC